MKLSLGVRYMLFAIFCFGLMNVGVKQLTNLSAVQVVFFRSIISLVISWGMLRAQGVSLWGTNRKILVMRGLFGATALTMYFYTVQNMPLATALVIQYLSPIFTAIIASLFLKEKLRPVQWLFFGVSFLGVLLIKGLDTRVSLGLLALGVLSAVGSGAAYNCIRKLKTSEHPLVIVFYFPLITVPITGTYSAFDWYTPQGMEWVWVLVVGLTTQVAQVFMTKAYQIERASSVAAMTYTGIFYALFFGYWLFDESYGVEALVGIAVVLLGVLLNVWYQQKMDKSEQMDAAQQKPHKA